MSHIDDWRTGGLWPAQDFDPDAALDGRSFMAGCRVIRHSTSLGEPFTIIEPNSLGDFVGALLVREDEPGSREFLNTWWWTGCPVIQDDASHYGWRPQKSAGKADARLGLTDFGTMHPVLGDQLYPVGWTGLMSAGSDETRQNEILHPDFLGLVAPHRDGREEHGTPVFDVDDKGRLDRRRWGRMQEHLRVALLPPQSGCMPGAGGREIGLLPLQFGVARSGIDAAGLIADEPSGGVTLPKPSKRSTDPGDVGDGLPPGVWEDEGQLFGPGPIPGTYAPYGRDGKPIGGVVFFKPPDVSGPGTGGSVTRAGTVPREPTPEQVGETQVDDVGVQTVADGGLQQLAMLSVRHGGPIDVGGPGDVHNEGATIDGEQVGQAHLSIYSLFRGPGWDVGLEFCKPPYERPEPGQIWQRVELRVDPESQHTTACGSYPGLGRWEAKTSVFTVPPGDPFIPEIPGGGGSGIPGPGDDYIPGGDGDDDDDDGELTDPIPEPVDEDELPPISFGGDPERFLDPSLGGFRFPGGVNPLAVIADAESVGSDRDRTLYSLIEAPNPVITGELGYGEFQGLTASLAPFSAPSIAFRPQNPTPGAFDFARATEVGSRQVREHTQKTPVVAQTLAFGETSGGEFAYTTQPGTKQFPGGGGGGGIMVAPDDVQITNPGASSSSRTFSTKHPGVIGGHAYPDQAVGNQSFGYLVGGWLNYMSGGDNIFLPLDDTGALDQVQMQLFSAFDVFEGFFSVNPYTDVGQFTGDKFTFAHCVQVGASSVVIDGDENTVQLADESSSTVSDASTGKIRYNHGSTRFEQSINGGAWAAFATGPTGAQGPEGPMGPPGFDGARGPEGPAGPIGPQGTQGPTGATGADGATGLGGPPGLDGVDGATGPAGPMGPQGIQGPIGPDGATGATGIPGLDGRDGETGPAGPPGPEGIQGVQGPIGVPGLSGPPGLDGIDGLMGLPGPIGPQGIQGVAGNDGNDGADGIDGLQGPPGLDGPPGRDGESSGGGGVQGALLDLLGLTMQSGDVLYVDGNRKINRLAKGSDDEVLTLASGLPSWAAAAGGGGDLELVEKKTLGAAATTVTFSGLDGDTDGIYYLFFQFDAANTFNGDIRPNGTTSNLSIQRSRVSGSSYAGTRISSWQVVQAAAGNHFWGAYRIGADKTGTLSRGIDGLTNRDSAGSAILYTHAGNWSETSTNITSIDIVASVANSFSSGGKFWLYKLAQS